MTVTDSPMALEEGVQRLLSSLAGVLSARVVADRDGRLREIHVLATAGLHPKQVVRNVESALRAGLGIEVDRRIVSVAQLEADAVGNGVLVVEAAASPEPIGSTPDARSPEANEARLVFVGFDARCPAPHEAVCRVVLRRGEEEFTGIGEGPATLQGRAEAAAGAVISALLEARQRGELGFEGASLVDAHGRRYVVVSAHGLAGRRSVRLAGAAPLDRSPEEAAILATLQATNRWSEVLS